MWGPAPWVSISEGGLVSKWRFACQGISSKFSTAITRSTFTTGSLDLKQDTNSASVYYYTFDAMLALKYSCFIASAAEQRCNGS